MSGYSYPKCKYFVAPQAANDIPGKRRRQTRDVPFHAGVISHVFEALSEMQEDYICGDDLFLV